MKGKITLACALILAALALFHGAVAETVRTEYSPVNPDRAEIISCFEAYGDDVVASATPLSVRLQKLSGDYTSTTTWLASASGGQGGYTYQFQLVRYDSFFPQGVELVYGKKYSGSSTASCAVVASGSYEMRVFARDGAGNSGYAIQSFEVDSIWYPTVDDRVAQILRDCAGAGCMTQFDTAVWLHDWLTQNARYDYSSSYYGSDGVLMRGTGVCDSYAKAYQKLMRAAGFECAYATINTASLSHAWNAVRLDGKWYWVDATWDDPDDSDGPVGGHENHLYFCLTDEIMRVDHANFAGMSLSGASGFVCDSYDDNYYLYTGRVSLWTGTFISAFNSALSGGSYLARITPPAKYAMEAFGHYDSGREHIVYTLAAYALGNITGWNAGGRSMPVTASYSRQTNQMTMRLRFDGHDLNLWRDRLSVIEPEAFSGNTAIMSVSFGDRINSVGAYAFANCENLWRVHVPNGIGPIDPTAFYNCPHVTIAGPAGGYAQYYANMAGLPFVEE